MRSSENPETPSFVLNSQVRVADWDQVHGTHQGQRQISAPRSKAGHRTELTNRAINAFFPCKADAIHTGRSRLLPMQLLLTQHLLALAEPASLLCGEFPKPAIAGGHSHNMRGGLKGAGQEQFCLNMKKATLGCRDTCDFDPTTILL